MMKKQKDTPVTELKSAGKIITSILRGNRTVMEIKVDLGIKHPTVIEQLAPLEKEKWIERNPETKKYSLNENKFISYWVKKFDLNKKELKQNLNTWLAIFANSGMDATIDSLGVYLKINSQLSKRMKAAGANLEKGILEVTKGAKKLAKKHPVKG